MRKLPYDYERIYNTCYLYAKAEHKGMSEEWYREKAEEDMEEAKLAILKLNMAYTIIEGSTYCSEKKAKRIAYKIVDNLPKELHQNLEEFIDGKPISEIKYGDTSIKEIRDTYAIRGRHLTFIECCEGMIDYIAQGCRSKLHCFQRFEII